MDIEEKAIRVNDVANDIIEIFADKFEGVGVSDKERIALIASSIMLIIKDIDALTNDSLSKVVSVMIDETKQLKDLQRPSMMN